MIDWNGNGRIDPSDIALTLAILEEQAEDEEEDAEEETIQLVTTLCQDALKGLISKESPVGKALWGKKEGDRVLIEASPTYSYYVQIRSVEKTGEDPDVPISTY